MTILTVGGEAECFSIGAGAYVVEGTAGRFDSNASRNALKITQGTSELGLSFAPLTELYAHVYIYQEAVAADDYIFLYGSTDVAFKIALESDGRWSIYKWAGASWGSALATSVAPVLVNEAAAIDIHILMNASGVFTIKKDGALVINYSGDTTGDATDMNNLYFFGLTGGGNEMNISQVIIADEDTTGMVLATLPVTGVGTLADWEGTYADIDEATLNESDSIKSGVGDEVSTFVMTDIGGAFSTYGARALAVGIAAKIDSASDVDTFDAAVRTGGTVYLSADDTVNGKDGTTYPSVAVFDTNPNGDVAWTKSAINGAEIGIKSIDNV